MNRNILNLIVALVLILPALPVHADPIVNSDWEELQKQQKKKNLPVLVLLTGSDWDPVSRRLLKVWNSDSFRGELNDIRILNIDHPKTVTDKSRDLNQRNRNFKFKARCYPVLFLLDKQYRRIGLKQGLYGTHNQLTSIIKEWRIRLEQRNILFKKAEQATGIERAKLLGEALDVLPFKIAYEYKNTRNQIKKLDKADQTGYVTKYFLPSMSRQAVDATKSKDKEQLLATYHQIKKLLDNKLLDKEQRLKLMANSVICLNVLPKYYPNAGYKERREKVLYTMYKMDPNHILGRTAYKYYKWSQSNGKLSKLLKEHYLDVNNDAKFYAYLKCLRDYPYRENRIHLSDKKPKGKLISIRARQSSSSQGSEANLRRLTTYDKTEGRWKTNTKKGPSWLMLDLQQVHRITGIVISYYHNTNNLTLQTSIDKKNWTDVYNLTNQDVPHPLIINLENKNHKARYIRAWRDSGKKKERLILSNFIVYGE